ncbi:FecR family protein [Phenylobacterium terrae]|uniref:FecR family protein n=1 Tax=Phenylobacterium terrae TaxID=2665495 RepID=A0ABW4N6L1_9CAUL
MHDVLSLDRLKAMDPDEAAALLVYRRADGAGELDAEVLSAWLRIHPANAAAWEHAQAAWSDFDGAADEDVLAALRAEARRAGPERPRWRSPAAVAAAAAAVVLVIAGALGLGLHRSEGSKSPHVAQTPAPAGGAEVYENREVEPEGFRLADGTWMVLDAGSAASIALAGSRREVTLVRGRAFFDVMPDPARPFAVEAGGRSIVVLGTRFDVRLQPTELRVSVVEGEVSVGPAGGGPPIRLGAGRQLVAREGEQPQVTPADVGQALEWHARYVVFDNVTLAEAAAQLNRLGPDQLIVRDPAVAGLRISGRFRADDLERFGRSLAVVHPVRLAPRGAREWEVVPAG